MPGLLRYPSRSSVAGGVSRPRRRRPGHVRSDGRESVASVRLVMAGYHDCADEAVRFLVEDEGRQQDDPTVVALTEHLQARSAYMEYLSLLERHEGGMEDELTRMLQSDRVSHQPTLSNQQRHLVETVFRGCDLVTHADVTSPPTNQSAPTRPPTRLSPANSPSKLRFQGNEYLDQILSWAYSEGN